MNKLILKVISMLGFVIKLVVLLFITFFVSLVWRDSPMLGFISLIIVAGAVISYAESGLEPDERY